MTSAKVLPAQPIPAAPAARPAGKQIAADAGSAAKGTANATPAPAGAPEAQSFANLFARLEAGMAGGGAAMPASLADAEAALQPKPLREGRIKGLRPEEALPPELLATLYPQFASQPQQALGAAGIGTLMPQPVGETSGGAEDVSLEPAKLQPSTAGMTPAAGLMAPAAPTDATAGQPAVPGAFAAALASTAASPATAEAGVPANAAPVAGSALPTQMPGLAPQAAAPAVQSQQPPANPAIPVLGPQQPRPEARAQESERTDLADIETGLAPRSSAETDKAPPAPERKHDVAFTVTRQETFLAPAGQAPVSHQAAERIISELKGTDAPAANASQPGRPDTAAQPVRVLHIQLTPPELGLLTVRLTLRENALDIKLEADEQRTVQMLEADRGKLGDMLRSAGYIVDALAVAPPPVADKATASFTLPPSAGDTLAQSGGGSQPGGAQPDAQRGQQPQAGNGAGASASRGGEEGENAQPGRPAGNDLYI